ncbi:MAG: ATP-binding protein [Prevotella sp.]|nr:ATP-binding protein [Prevotella sp.]
MNIDLELILSEQKAELQQFNSANCIYRAEQSQINLDSTLAQIVIGVRRSGKSTLCKQAMLSSGNNFGYVDFDDDRLAQLTSSDFDAILTALYHINGNLTHLYFDEIQNIKGWELFVNRMLRQGKHIIITGSNANLLSEELATHLTGRHHQIELYPFSFQEYCKMKGVDTDSYTTLANALRDNALVEYLFSGGLPELFVLKENECRTYILSLFNAIIEKDICRRYKVRYPNQLKDIANLLLDEFAQEQSFRMILDKLKLSSVNTVKKYVEYLTNAYLVCSVPRMSFKNRDRRTLCKYYSIDLAFVSARENALQTESLGLRLENAVALFLKKRTRADFSDLYYLKYDRDYEVDFAVVKSYKVTELVQVTYDFRNPSTKLYNREVGNLIKASKVTGCDNLTLVMMYGQRRTIEVDGKQVRCVPATEYLLKS